jgi:hypothetical protein
MFVSSKFLPLEDAAIYASSMKLFPAHAPLLLSFSGISAQPYRALVLLRNGNLMASSFVLGSKRKYFRLSFPEDPASTTYRGPTVATSSYSDLFRMLSHFCEQLVHMNCSPLPSAIDELEQNVIALH